MNDKPLEVKCVTEVYPREKDCKALLALDVDYWREEFGYASMTDEVLLIAMHKVRYELTELPDAARHESREWLYKNGYRRVFSRPLLPPGELPR